MMQLKNISFAYKRSKNKNVISNFSLTIRKGEFVSILGPSGCGKTTLVSIIAGYLKPDSGSLKIYSKEIKGAGRDRILVNQENDLFEWMSVLENVKLMCENQEHALKFINLVGLKDHIDHYPNQLSGGMKKKLSLARALSVNPKILLLDEPFGSLDIKTKESLQQEVSKIIARNGNSTLLVTHDIDEAIFLSDRIVIFSSHD